MNRVMKFLAVIACGVVLSACGSISVNTDYDTSKDFSSLKSFAWMAPSQKLVVDPLVDNDLMNQRIQRSVESELQKLGYSKASGEESADFFITYHVKAEDKISVTSFHGSYGYYPCWHGCVGMGVGYNNDVHVRQYKQGTFMLDIIDPASEKLMWRGSAGKRLEARTPDERNEYVQNIVAAILAKFPPGRE